MENGYFFLYRAEGASFKSRSRAKSSQAELREGGVVGVARGAIGGQRVCVFERIFFISIKASGWSAGLRVYGSRAACCNSTRLGRFGSDPKFRQNFSLLRETMLWRPSVSGRFCIGSSWLTLPLHLLFTSHVVLCFGVHCTRRRGSRPRSAQSGTDYTS